MLMWWKKCVKEGIRYVEKEINGGGFGDMP